MKSHGVCVCVCACTCLLAQDSPWWEGCFVKDKEPHLKPPKVFLNTLSRQKSNYLFLEKGRTRFCPLTTASNPVAYFCHPLMPVYLQVTKEDRKSLTEVDFPFQPNFGLTSGPVHPTFGKVALSSSLIRSHNANRSSLCWKQRLKPPLTARDRQWIKEPWEHSQNQTNKTYFKIKGIFSYKFKCLQI